ncbi:MAG TPA: hypothetical protein PLU43_05885 [Lachnospiraceae bacterium]|nr:hypothetical protein [Lachnospiraceae bacterium]
MSAAVSLPFNGSLTVEAALVLPLFLFSMIALLSLLSLLLFHVRVQGVLQQQAKYMAQQAYTEAAFDKEDVCLSVLDEIGEYMLSHAPIKGGAEGLDFSETKLSDREFIKLSVSYEAELPYDLFHLFHYQFSQDCLMHTWIGYEKGLEGIGQDKEEEIVYITEDSEVYHRDRECSYLRLKIKEVSPEEIETLRNSSGEKYKSCELCHGSLTDSLLYITEDGGRYHSSLDCSGLKRTVTAIPISKVGNRRPCSRCGCLE